MLTHVPAVLKPEQVAECRRVLEGAEWIDGRASAGPVAAQVKNNQEVALGHPAFRQAGEIILTALGTNPLVIAIAQPLRVTPPFFNRYQGGETYGLHNDSALIHVPGAPMPVRGDLAATLFLTAPDTYDGGELVVEDTYGTHRVKLPAGDMILYPASSLHRVMPVTRGARVSSFFWIQSMVRDDGQRTLLFELGTALKQFEKLAPEDPAIIKLTGVYFNLFRMWTDTG
jgi:PKHD-type hydroxylase